MKFPSNKVLFVVLFLFAQVINSQEQDYSSFAIPAELKENANAVIRNNSTLINVISPNEMTVEVNRTITVLNKLGNSKIGAYVHYDNDSKVTKLSAKIYDAFGRQIKKVSKSNFKDVSAVDGGTLYSDSRVKYLEYTPLTYPYTVQVNYVYKTSSTGFIPSWFPVDSYYVSIENSEYKLQNPSDIIVRVKENHFNNFKTENHSEGNNLHYKLKNQPALKFERHTLSLHDLLPSLSVGLNNFSLKGIRGAAKDWSDFGRWRYIYLKNGNDQLSEDVKNRARKLVEGVESDVEKAKIIYKYMQGRTRYISVQEGIGGWKPIPANEVDNLGYGDCKGLTNYTKALLDAVGVKSYYTVLWAGSEKRNVYKDFFSMQGNHVILNLPQEDGEDIWLECTSQTAPFGFLGDFTDDRDVLVVTPEGGVIKRTTSYKNDFNLQKMKAKVTLSENGSVKGEVTIKTYGIQYDSKYQIETYNQKEKVDYYKTTLWDYNNNLSVNNIKHLNDKDKIEFTEKLNVNIDEFAAVSGDKLLLRVNVFNINTNVPKRYRSRQQPLKIERGYKDEDTFEIIIPVSYSADDGLFETKSIENKFGKYNISIEKIADNKLLYKRTLLINEGVYSKEDYKTYRSFRRKVSRYDNIKIALTKN